MCVLVRFLFFSTHHTAYTSHANDVDAHRIQRVAYNHINRTTMLLCVHGTGFVLQFLCNKKNARNKLTCAQSNTFQNQRGSFASELCVFFYILLFAYFCVYILNEKNII